jgi:hypothetical protein
VLRPPPIEFSPLFVGECKLAFTFVFAETLPQRHRKLGSITGGEFQELGKWTRWHGLMVSRVAVMRQYARHQTERPPLSRERRSHSSNSPDNAAPLVGCSGC